MKSKWITFALALAFAVPAFAQKPAAEKITDGPRVEGVGDNWAIIAWTTNTGGSSVVKYGTSAGSLTQTAEAPYSDNEKTQGPEPSRSPEKPEAQHPVFLHSGVRSG